MLRFPSHPDTFSPTPTAAAFFSVCRGGPLTNESYDYWHAHELPAQDGDTPLHVASSKGRAELVRMLLEHGARMDICDRVRGARLDQGGRGLRAGLGAQRGQGAQGVTDEGMMDEWPPRVVSTVVAAEPSVRPCPV